ncbi:putative C3a anaphylatoxin chemotactic receptor-like [Triplophysa rosa]|uniref:C3a anaphylatoxin chemotactic receptor-like n=1 Tax=Triplophysa rosa TaxID=992332 RepID=A0A9W7TLL3_TRIRA|nr:putative C3a anaphylatoxin chemotactic receptor-like [Triplophysa rosa]
MFNTTQQTESLSSSQIVTICVYLAMFIVGLVGNGLVIFITGFKMKSTVNSIWFLNLAIADVFFALAPIMRIVLISAKAKYVASVFFLTVISLDRCLCTWVVVWAQNKRTLVKARIICVFVWLSSICCSIPFVINFYNKNLDLKSLFAFRFSVGFLLPFLVIASSYMTIALRVKRLKKGKVFRPFRLIVALVLVFFICWFPYHIHKLLNAAENKQNASVREKLSKTRHFVICLTYVHSCVNPILYVFICEEYKQKLKQSLLLVLETTFAEEHLEAKKEDKRHHSHLFQLPRQENDHVQNHSQRDLFLGHCVVTDTL